MTFALTKPAGWAFGEIFTSAQAEDLDAKTAAAIDGVGGGTYAPSAQIVIGGSGFKVTTVLDVTGTLNLTGDATIGNSSADDLTVVATAAFDEVATFNDGILVAAGGIEVHGTSSFGTSPVTFGGNASVTGTLDVTGAGTFHDDLIVASGALFNCNSPADFADAVTFNGATQFNGAATFSDGATIPTGDTLNINGTLLLKSAMTFASSGRVPLRYYGTLPNSSVDLSASDGQLFEINKSTTATRTYTLSSSGATSGDWMLFFTGAGNSGNPDHASVIDPGNADNIYTFPAGGNNRYALYVFSGGSWKSALHGSS